MCFNFINAQQPFYYVNAKIYSEKEGFIVFNRVNNISEDNDGLIWISNGNGLQSFNGTHFRNYRHSTKDTNSLPGNNVHFIYQDKQNTYWTYIKDKGLYNYDPKKESFSKYRYHNEKEFNLHQSHQFQIGRPFEDKEGRIWFPLLGYGLVELDRKKNIVIPYKICIPGNCGSFYNASWVTNIFEDSMGGFWLATNGGLVYFNKRTSAYEEIIEPELQARSVFEERYSVFNYFGPQINDDIWIGTWGNGIKKLNIVTRRFETFLWYPKTWDGTKNICTGIWQKDSTHLWVSTMEKELFVFDLRTHQFQPARQLGNEDFVFAAGITIQAKDGSLWMTHVNRSLIKISKKQFFSSYSFRNDQAINPENFATNCFLRMGNNLFIGAEFDTRIYRFDLTSQNYRSYQIPENYYRGETNFLLPAPEQKGFYAGGYHGLFFFNSNKEKFEAFKTNTTTERVLKQELLCAVRGKDNSIWMACRNKNVLLRYFPETGETKEYFITPDNDVDGKPYTDYWVNSIISDAHDNIWFSHSHYGLGCLSISTGKVTFFNSFRKKDFPIGMSTDVCVTDDGSIYFTILGEGVWRLKNPFTTREEIVNYDQTNGLPSDMIRFVHQDQQKNIWFFSNNGISLFDPESGNSKNFSDADGLKSKNITARPYEDGNGVIYIGFTKAFQTFQPDSLARNKIHTSKLIVHDFKVNNVSWPSNVNYADEVRLKPAQTYIQFQYAAITHDNPEQLNYSYILEGFDHNWINAGTSTFGNYNNLPAGNYTLKIKVDDKRDPDQTNYFELPIVITGYWYKSTWFKMLLGIVFFVLIFILIRYRVAGLHKEARLKAEFTQKMSEVEMRVLRAQMNPHFIFNSLSSINRYIVKSDHKTASEYLTKFSKLIRMILDNSATDLVSIEKEIQSLQLYIEMEALRFDHAFIYIIEIDESIDQEECCIPSMLLQPYVENAIWHGLLHKETGKGKLTIKLSKISDTMLAAQIEDNGIGRKKAKEMKSKEVGKKKSYGMQISHDRLALLNPTNGEFASVLIEDLVNEKGIELGTRVTLHIPIQYKID